ncbi:hypothetical protein Ddc_13642 [Ditylenchus destructor]|nr:hypothetical protein Ddc_13642 [Ditylenchus destructor]
MIDEIEEEDDLQCEFPNRSHPIVEVKCSSKVTEYTHSYKWLQFKLRVSPPAVLEKWQYGWLSAGKP